MNATEKKAIAIAKRKETLRLKKLALLESQKLQPLTNEQIAQATKLAKVIKKTASERKAILEAKENKVVFDYVKLANVTDYIENRTASKVYKNCIASPYASQIVGKKTMPTFQEFLTALPVKVNYSNWDGYKALKTFNIKANLVAKAKRQSKAESKK